MPKEQLPQVRPRGGALTRFTFGGVTCSQKVGRWETGGEKEIWEFVFEQAAELAWSEPHPGWDLFVVKSGSVQVEAAGQRCTAKARDIINIPPYTPHTLTVLVSGPTLHAYNCQSMVLRWMEELELKASQDAELLKNPEAVREILGRHGCYLTSCTFK